MANLATDQRNGIIAKIHVAKKQLAIEEDSYRALLQRVTGLESLKAMDEHALETVLKELQRLGFKPKGGKRAGTRKMADTEQAGKIRALWLDLYHLGEINDASEENLARFVERMTKCRALQWLDSAQADAAIKALRGWLQRVGFEAPDAPLVRAIAIARFSRGIEDADTGIHHLGVAWKVCIIRRQMDILGVPGIVDDIPINPLLIRTENLDATIESFGRALRKLKGRA